MKYHSFQIKQHKIILAGNENGISHLMFNNGTKAVQIDKTWEESSAPFLLAKQQLSEYFEGKRTSFDLQLNPAGTSYQKQVWNVVSQIPYGQLYSYKQVAEQMGNPKAARAIGLANNRNPIPVIIPCHRVVGADKKLVGYAYGLELKNELIELEKTNNTFAKLTNYYGDIHRSSWSGNNSWWPANSAFEMMAGAILTQNTNWQNVEKALANLGENTNPQFIQGTPNQKLAELIRPSGYHNQKAKKLKALCAWFSKYNFKIDKASAIHKDTLRKELLEVNGIGGETADCILVYALNKPSFVIDAYTRRIFSRIGIDVPNTYEAFRLLIEKFVPCNVKTYDYYHGLVVEHAKTFCTKTPQCKGCPLEDICEKKDCAAQITMKL